MEKETYSFNKNRVYKKGMASFLGQKKEKNQKVSIESDIKDVIDPKTHSFLVSQLKNIRQAKDLQSLCQMILELESEIYHMSLDNPKAVVALSAYLEGVLIKLSRTFLEDAATCVALSNSSNEGNRLFEEVKQTIEEEVYFLEKSK